MAKKIDPNTFHGRLRLIRKTLKLTQDQFCQQLKVSKPTLVRYESGDRHPDSELLEYIAVEYRVNMNWLFFSFGDMFLRPNMEADIVVEREDGELCELLETMNIPQIRRAVLSEFDKLKVIFRELLGKDNLEAEKKEK